eukprot:m.1138079 g.1138079  ORF g.1138079 m.1138079 type:complete len:657 (-) comp24438_c0_seq3:324-2294(-)
MPPGADGEQAPADPTTDIPAPISKSALKKTAVLAPPAPANHPGGAATRFDCTVLKKGWGFKEGSFVKSWRKRWFILREKMQREFKSMPDISHVLLYFQTMEQAANGLIPTGAIPLSSKNTNVEVTTRGNRKCLAITTNGVKRVLYLQPCGKVKKESMQDPEAKEASMEEALGEWTQVLTTFEVPSGFGRLRMDTLGQPPVRVSQLIEDEYGSEDEREGVSYEFASESLADGGEENLQQNTEPLRANLVIGLENDQFKDVLQKVFLLKQTHPKNIGIGAFDSAYFSTLSTDDKLSLLQIINSGIENPSSTMGCYAMQPSDYDRFRPFFAKVLAAYHGVGEDAKHVNNWDLSSVGTDGAPPVLDLSLLGLPPLSMRVRVGRNLHGYPLPGAMSKADRVALEARMCEALAVLQGMEEYGGRYHSLTPGHAAAIDDATYAALVDEHIMFKNMADDPYLVAAGIAADWPHGRGCYVSEDRSVVVWVGEEDHLRVISMHTGTVLSAAFDRLRAALDVLGGIDGLAFAMSPDYGVVTSCPTNVGSGMRASVLLPLPRLTADGTDTAARAIATPLGLSVRGVGGARSRVGADGMCDVSLSARLCVTEAHALVRLYDGLKLLKRHDTSAAPQTASVDPASGSPLANRCPDVHCIYCKKRLGAVQL